MTIELNGDSGISTPSPVILSGSTSGTITLAAPAVAGTNTITLPARTGTVVTSADTATVTPTMMTQPLTLATAKAFNWNSSSSNTFIDFESIPSWVKHITVMFSGVSTNGTAELRLQLGTSSGITTSGYNGFQKRFGSTSLTTNTNVTNGIGVQTANVSAALTFQGVIKIYNITSNTWVAEVISQGSDDTTCIGVSSVSLASVLDRVRFTTSNGTDTFDAGTINIMYE